MAETEIQRAPAWVSWGRSGIRLLPRGRYPLMNWLCRRPTAPFESPLGVTRDRVRFVCDLGDAVAREACFMGHYEPQETVLVRHLLRPGMCFVDVGANWGYFTLLAAHLVGARGRVVAFEPHPELFSLLERNVSANGFEWVTAERAAVGEAEGEKNLAGFDAARANRGLSRLTDGPDAGVPNYRVRTRLLEPCLDAHGVGEVDLLKMDIEGGEAAVLPTMSEGLARARYRYILLELHPRALAAQGRSAASLVETITGHGYRAWRIDHSAKAYRGASYKLPESPAGLLAPHDPAAPLDDWPHLIFVAPHAAPVW